MERNWRIPLWWGLWVLSQRTPSSGCKTNPTHSRWYLCCLRVRLLNIWTTDFVRKLNSFTVFKALVVWKAGDASLESEKWEVCHASSVFFFFFFLTSNKQLQRNILLLNNEVMAKLWSQSSFLQVWGRLLQFGVKEVYSWHHKLQLGKIL